MSASPLRWLRSKNRPRLLATAFVILPICLPPRNAAAEEFAIECDQVDGDGMLPYATVRVNPDRNEVVLTYSRWPAKLFADKRKYMDDDCPMTQSVSITDAQIKFSEVGSKGCGWAGREPEHIYKIDRTTGRMDVVRLARALISFFSQYRCSKTGRNPKF